MPPIAPASCFRSYRAYFRQRAATVQESAGARNGGGAEPLFAVLYRYDKLRNYGLTYELPCFLEYSYFAELV